jgi:DNA-binding NarL/FixJ family response regulator
VAASEPLTIAIADDHAIVRQGLRLMLEAEAELSIVGEASDVEETFRLLQEASRACSCLTSTCGAD